MAYENLIVTERANTRIVTINRPKTLNSLTKKTLLELERALLDLENSQVRAMVLTGAGEKSFVAGADISEMKSFSPIEAEEFSVLGHRVFDRIEQSKVPVIAAVNGYALGGGLELALACDFIYASENATFGLVETKLGLIPGFGGCARLAKRVGEARAKEMVFSAAQITAQEAMRIGLINRVVQEGAVVDATLAIAEKIGHRGPYAVQLTKSLISNSQSAGIKTANAMEQKCFGLVFSSKDHKEGIKAFLEKRQPSFVGR